MTHTIHIYPNFRWPLIDKFQESKIMRINLGERKDKYLMYGLVYIGHCLIDVCADLYSFEHLKICEINEMLTNANESIVR